MDTIRFVHGSLLVDNTYDLSLDVCSSSSNFNSICTRKIAIRSFFAVKLLFPIFYSNEICSDKEEVTFVNSFVYFERNNAVGVQRVNQLPQIVD